MSKLEKLEWDENQLIEIFIQKKFSPMKKKKIMLMDGFKICPAVEKVLLMGRFMSNRSKLLPVRQIKMFSEA